MFLHFHEHFTQLWIHIMKKINTFFLNFYLPTYLSVPLGGQTNGPPGSRRPSVPTAQMRVLHEGHRAHVPVSVAGAYNPVPSDAVP